MSNISPGRKRIHLRILLFFFVIVLIGACAQAPTMHPYLPANGTTSIENPGGETPSSSMGILPSPQPEPSKETSPTAEAKPVPQLPLYQLTAVLDYARHFLTVEEQITYTNNGPESMGELRLMVEPLSYPGVFELTGLNWSDGQPITNYELQGAQIHIPLNSPLPATEQIQLFVSFTLDLPSPTPSPEIRPIPFGYTARQTNLVDWYPFIPPFIPGQGWIAHPPGFFGEHLAYELSDFEVKIRISDPRTDLVIAASAPAQSDGEWFVYKHPAARNFAWSVSHEYLVLSKEVDQVTVLSYAFPYDQAAGQAALETTAEALQIFSSLFGPYTRQTLSIVEADFLDGMEFDGLYFLSDGFYNLYQGQKAEYLTAIAAHETAHQWWYARVGNDQALEPWLDEALCTYSEHIYYEKLYPEALDWWWTYRVRYYDPQGWVDSTIYSAQGYRAYRDAVYLNGAVFLSELRETIGDQVFWKVLNEYAEIQSGEISTGEEFFEIVHQNTQVALSPLLERFFQESYP